MNGSMHIRIDRLVVRVRGVPAETARAAAQDLGTDVGHRLATDRLETAILGDVTLGSIEIGRRVTPAELRGAVAEEIASAVAQRSRGEVA
jgi:hypothetical protein